MARAIVMRAPGGPEVLKAETVEPGEPAAGEVRLRQTAVGKDTFLGSMACLARLGHLVNFGQASGPVDPIPMSLLFQKSNSVTRPSLFHYIEDRSRREEMTASLFNALADGIVTPGSIHEYRIEDVGRAQRDMAERKTAGAVILTP